jgi:hypothetical protein
MGSYVVLTEPSTAGEDFGRQLAGTPESWARSDFEKAVCALKQTAWEERSGLFNEQESSFHSVLLMVSRKKGLQSVARDIK